MARVNLSMDDRLFDAIQAAATKKNTTVNLLILNILESAFCTRSFDYASALQTLIAEAEARPAGDFTMADLPSFAALCVSTAENGFLQPATLRARLGKAFNVAVREGRVSNVSRATIQKRGRTELKFLDRAAVYEKKNVVL